MDFTEQDKAEEWFNNSEHGKGRIAGFVPILMAEYAEHYHQSKVKDLGLFSVSQLCELLFEFNEWVANDRRSTTVKQLVDGFIKEKFK